MTQFTLWAEPPEGHTVTGWQLSVVPVAGGAAVTQTAGSNLPTAVGWNGRDAGGQVVGAGAYSYTLLVTASNGLTAATEPQTVLVVSGPPAAPEITEPDSGASTGYHQVWVAGTAEPGSTLALLDAHGYFTDTVVTDENGQWGLTRSLAGGANVLYAVAENAFGAGPPSTQVVVHLVPTPPLYPPTYVWPPTTFNGEEITFSALARHDKSDEGRPTVAVTATLLSHVFELTRTSISAPPITGTWETTWTVSGLNNGDYRVEFAGVDEDGVAGHGESTLRVQDPPPAPRFTYPTQPITRAQAALTLGGAAQAFSTLRLYVDGDLHTTQPVGSIGTWNIPVTLGDGTHAITATATDSLGQVSPPGAAPAITIDTVPPTVSMEDLPAFQNQTGWTLRWAGSDPDPGTGVLAYRLDHQLGESGVWQTLHYNTSLTEWPYSTSQEGIHNFRVRALDRAYNTGDWAQTSTVLDRTAPGLGLVLTAVPPYAYADGSTVYYRAGSSGAYTVTALATDTLSGLDDLVFPDATSAGMTYPFDGEHTVSQPRGYSFSFADTRAAR